MKEAHAPDLSALDLPIRTAYGSMRMLRLRHLLLVPLVALPACGDERSSAPPIPLADYVLDVAVSEAAASDIERHVLQALAHELARVASTTEDDAFEFALAESFRGVLPELEDGAIWADDHATIREFGAGLGQGLGPALDDDDFRERLLEHASSLGSIERKAFELDRFRLSTDGLSATGRGELLLGGGFMTGERTTWTAVFGLEFVRGDSGWLLAAAVLERATRLTTVLEPFRDVTALTGFNDYTSEENRELLQRLVDVRRTQAMGGLTVVDWNRDGLPDVLATRGGQTATLLLNDARGGFVPTPLPFRHPRECPAMAIVVDLDGDGHDEIVGSWPQGYDADTATLGLWTRSGKGWETRHSALTFPNPRGLRRLAIQTVVPFDADDDGDLDLFVAVYGNHLSRSKHYNTVEAHDGGDNHLFLNDGDLKFREVSLERGIHGTQYTYVALAFDFDGDGDLDLFEGNDFGPNVMWSNDGEGHFTADTALGFDVERGYTMGATLGDPDGEGVWSLYVSNMSSEQGARMIELADDVSQDMVRSLEHIASGNALHVQGPNGWTNEAQVSGCAEAEWAWGCAFWDPDNDGDRDLIVTNGFTSHRTVDDDWQTYYWRQVLEDAQLLEAGKPTRNVNAGQRFEGSFNGYERDRLFLNPDGNAPRAGRRFVEAGWNFGLDAAHDGRAVAPIDFDGDGDLDLALWTLQGLRLLENRLPEQHFVRLGLRGTNGHASALGATVEVRAGTRTQRDHVKWVEGFQTQVLADLHFGLGQHAGPIDITVHWPGGRTQTWDAVPTGGFVELVEGELDARLSALKRWPQRSLRTGQAPLGSQMVTSLNGGRAPLAGTGKPTVVRVGGTNNPKHPWPQARVLNRGDDPPHLVWLPGRTDLAGHDLDRVARILAPDMDLIESLMGTGTRSDGVLVFDRDRNLVRMFVGAPRLKDLQAVLQALEQEEPFVDLLVEDGRTLLTQGRFREAGAVFQRAVAIDPERTDVWDGLAQHHLAFGRTVRAREAWEQALAFDPDYALGHFNLGIHAQGRGQLPEARAHLEEAVDLAPEDERMWLALAEIAAQDSDLERTVEAAEQASQLTTDAAPRILQGKALGQLRRLTEAQAAFEDALARDPDASEARSGLRKVQELLQKAGD